MGFEQIKNLNENQVLRSVKLELYPTKEQAQLIQKYISISNYIYNKTIDIEENNYKLFKQGLVEKTFLNKYDIRLQAKEFWKNDEIASQVPWHMCYLAVYRAIKAYESFFKLNSNYPKYHIGKCISYSYDIRTDSFYIKDDYVHMEGFAYNNIKCQHSNFSQSDKYYHAKVYFDKCNRYWIIFMIVVDKKYIDKPKTQPIGIDLGFRSNNSNNIVCSNGITFQQPDMDHYKRKLSRECKQCMKDYERRKEYAIQNGIDVKDVPKSKRSIKREQRRNATYRKISNIKNNFNNQISSIIVGWNPESITVEGFNMEDIKKDNKYVPFHNFNAGDFRNKLEYKSEQAYIPFTRADRNFPSSKICSNCGAIYDIPSYAKYYRCSNCGAIIDRDLNASINLERYKK